MKKIVLVTGGNKGISKAITIQLAKEGYAIYINYKLDKKSALDIVNQIRYKGGVSWEVQAGITSEKGITNTNKHQFRFVIR